MRQFIGPFELGAIPISEIQLDLHSRDDIPQILKGLQYIYTTFEIRNVVFDILDAMIPSKIDRHNGRPGMALWNIFVMGVLRLNLNCDYDRILERVNQHRTIRQMLGHADFENLYKLQTLKDNISLFTPSILNQINVVVVKTGHQLFKKTDEILKGHCDTFVVETDVHYPTDTHLLFDAIRIIISMIAELCKKFELSSFSNSAELIGEIKNSLHYLQRLKHSTSKDEEKKPSDC